MHRKASIKHSLLFIIILLGISTFYNFRHIMFYRPYGLHVWRQCDCASIAHNYYLNGMHFFQPELNNNLDNGHGYAVEEFPWIYYMAAILYKLFGFHEFLFRSIILLCFFIGLYALFRLSYLITGSYMISYTLPIILFSAPDAIFYGSNFLPNIPAVSFELLALWMFFEYYYSKKYIYFILSSLFYLVCGLTKISCLISFSALFAIFIFEKINLKINKKQENIFTIPWLTLCLFILVIATNYSWYSWAKHYDIIHKNGVFLIGILPIWQMHPYDIMKTTEKILTSWSGYYFFAPTFFILILLVPALYFNIKKLERIEALLFSFMSIGVLIYILLFFNTFYDHDYYFICLYSFCLLTILFSFKTLKKYFSKIWNNKLYRITLILYLIGGIIDTRYMVNTVIYVDNKYQINPDIYDKEFADFLSQKKIFGNVLVIPDVSPDNSLYLINRRGSTNFPSLAEDPVLIKKYRDWGTKFLILTDSAYGDRPDVKPFLKNKIGNYKSISVYNINNN
jgi:hypothetical protein